MIVNGRVKPGQSWSDQENYEHASDSSPNLMPWLALSATGQALNRYGIAHRPPGGMLHRVVAGVKGIADKSPWIAQPEQKIGYQPNRG
jgi:hypothetical protein